MAKSTRRPHDPRRGGTPPLLTYAPTTDNGAVEPISMLRYIAAYFAVKLAAVFALILYIFNFDGELPISSMLITFIAVTLPIAWFAKSENRPMLSSERLRFAVGNTALEVALTLAWGIIGILIAGVSFSLEGLSHILGGGGEPEAAMVAIVIGLTIGLLPTPIFSAFFG